MTLETNSFKGMGFPFHLKIESVCPEIVLIENKELTNPPIYLNKFNAMFTHFQTNSPISIELYMKFHMTNERAISRYQRLDSGTSVG